VSTGVGEDDTDLLKVPQVAKMLSLSEVTVWRLIGSGVLESLKLGRSRRIAPEAVEDFKKRRRQSSAPSADQTPASAA
jgi:excisionase family DNA binding protein